MAACTLRRSGSETGTDPVITWETVPTETPAISATFLMLGMLKRSLTVAAPIGVARLSKRSPAASLQLLQSDIARFDLHGRSPVNLYADQAFELAPGGIVVDQHAGDAAIE